MIISGKIFIEVSYPMVGSEIAMTVLGSDIGENIQSLHQNINNISHILSKCVYETPLLYNCSQTKENDQFALFKSTRLPRSFNNWTVILCIFTGPK